MFVWNTGNGFVGIFGGHQRAKEKKKQHVASLALAEMFGSMTTCLHGQCIRHTQRKGNQEIPVDFFYFL